MKKLLLIIIFSILRFFSFAHSSDTSGQHIYFDVNKLKFPINNMGIIADVPQEFQADPYPYCVFDERTIMSSAGFFLSGKINDTLFANGSASTSLIWDYVPGNVGSDSADPKNLVYVVDRNDAPFSLSWLQWKDAVNQGADFYDGDGNNVYEPVDKNLNGQWDDNEDKPLIIGDRIAWTVFNDNATPWFGHKRQAPLGIEIQQTIFASHTNNDLTSNIVFIRYRLINKTYTKQTLDSVYFSLWSDPDIGDYWQNLVGCDTLLQCGYAYKDDTDSQYGTNSPSFLMQLLQGPKSGNDNLKASSFISYYTSEPSNGDPYFPNEIRNYQTGLNFSGYPIDPCTWHFGNVNDHTTCSQINNKFWYSGDPVKGNGWVNNTIADQKMMLSSGPFTLQYNDTVNITGAYIAGRGSSALESVTKVKEIAAYSRQMYEDNFISLPLSVQDENLFAPEYNLEQNFPNPFNPTTTISFTIPFSSKVSVKIFDVLGNEIKTLVNEVKEKGKYKINFNASDLGSGVYFYRLTADSYIKTNKMLLIK